MVLFREFYENQLRQRVSSPQACAQASIQERQLEDLNASKLHEIEQELHESRRNCSFEWQQKLEERLKEVDTKPSTRAAPPKPSERTKIEFRDDLFQTTTLLEVREELRPVSAKPLTQKLSAPRAKTPLHKTDSLLEQGGPAFVPGSQFDFQTSTPKAADKLPDLMPRLSVIPQAQPAAAPVQATLQTPAVPRGQPVPRQILPELDNAARNQKAAAAEANSAQAPGVEDKTQFTGWVEKLSAEHKALRTKLTQFRKANSEFCNSLKLNMNAAIDIYTSRNVEDKAMFVRWRKFFVGLLEGEPVKGPADERELRLDPANELQFEYAVAWLCERYLKLIAGAADMVEYTSTAFTMLIMAKSVVRDRLLGAAVAGSCLVRLDADLVAKKMDELAALSPEEAANWLPEETNRCRFLLKCCFYTHTAASPGMPGGMAVVDTLFRTAAHSAPVPVASCFVLHILFSVAGKYLQKTASFPQTLPRIKALLDMDWNTQLTPLKARLSKLGADVVLESRHNVTLQLLRSSLTALGL